MSEMTTLSVEDINAAADSIQNAFPGLKAGRAIIEHVAISLLRRGMLIERRTNAENPMFVETSN